ncbi:MAG: hypothetical protein J1E60_06175 [Christensenellaceae bacterium]|nr:hypothetical protein [Christensenellaceae bacterium]
MTRFIKFLCGFFAIMLLASAMAVPTSGILAEEAADIDWSDVSWDNLPDPDHPLFDAYWHALEIRQEPAIEAGDAMQKFYRADCNLKDTLEYPDYYSGSYIGKDFKFHFSFVKGADEALERCLAALADYSGVIVFDGFREHSYNELWTYLDEFIPMLEDAGCKLSDWCVDLISGELNVTVFLESFDDSEKVSDEYREAHPDIPIVISTTVTGWQFDTAVEVFPAPGQRSASSARLLAQAACL